MRLALLSLVAVVVMLLPLSVAAQPAPPAPGVQLPQAYFDEVAKDRNAFQFQRAWLQKFERVKEAQRNIEELRKQGVALSAVPRELREQAVMAGTAFVPVILIKYSNTGADPYPASDMDNKLFTSNPTGTMSAFYSEMSYGQMTLTGTVYGWLTATNTDVYYEGGANGLQPGVSKTGELILQSLQGIDGSVDFGQYDNDGPDGIPNSGDDDGFVDFIAIVHPEVGGECGTTNIWSHRWVVGAWPAFGRVGNSFGPPWSSNDPAAGGGVIRVWDYTIQPALGSVTGCGPNINEIGVFAHEFGHAFGLPDFYDTNGGGQGIGEHGLMGSGNWQIPSNPTHMSPHSKFELGWLTPTEIGPFLQSYNINDVETNPDVYQANIYEEKFNRKSLDPIAGSFSLHCGLAPFPAGNRNWPGGKGYGNLWNEAIRRTFSYDGVNPVTLQYDVAFDSEPGYDFSRVWIDVNGTLSQLAQYDNVGSINNVTIDLTPYLNGSGATEYDIIFRFTSDIAWSDEDNLYNCATAPLRVDNVSVTGGGESYFSDFELNEAGWCIDFAQDPPREYFLVENRNRSTGLFDNNTNSEGLHIWHVDKTVGDNTSGSSSTINLRPARLTVECADGLNQLLLGANRGDAGDSFPGSTNNTNFDNLTNPNSKSNNDFGTNVIVTNIGPAGVVMTADMQAGRFAPTLASITPNVGDNDQVVPITALVGTFMYKGGTFCLRMGMTEYPATNVEWVGKALVLGDLDLNGVPGGTYDVVWKGTDGQEAILAGGFTVNAVATGIGTTAKLANRLEQNYPNPFNPTTTISYAIKDPGQVTLRIFNAAGQVVRTLVDEVQMPRAGGFSVVWDGRSDAGSPVASGVYMYKLTAANGFESVRKLVMLK